VLMERLNTLKLRKHPGGLRGFITTFRILFFLALVLGAVNVVASFMMTCKSERFVSVTSRKEVSEQTVKNGELIKIKNSAVYRFKPQKVAHWLLFDPKISQNIFSSLFTLAIVWYAFKIFEALKLDNPFVPKVAGYMTTLGWVIIMAAIFNILRNGYLHFAVKELTEKGYKFSGSDSGYSLGLGIIILIIAQVFKKGCELQEDKDLTI